MSASDDVIATLSSRVSELSKRLALLETELEAAQKRLAIYEEHDQTIQDALSGALKAAYTIRERADTTAAQILEQAREERRVLLKEIERLRDERDQLQNDMAEQRRSGIAAVNPRPLTSDTAAHELRAVASEALRGLFQEIVDDMRARPSEPQPAPPIPEPPKAVETPKIEITPEPVRAEPVEEVETAPTYEYMKQVKRPEPEAQRPEAAAQPTEDVEVAAPPPPPPPPLEVVASREVEEIAPPRVETGAPTTDIQLVLSPVPSFPRLVEIERHIQSLPAVRTLYVRDFRVGVATIAVALRSPMTPEEFGVTLTGLSELRLHLVSWARNSLELRIDGAASIA